MIRAQTRPADKIAVLGSEPEIYFYAHRHAATGYVYTYPLVENHAFASKMQGEMIDQIEAERPEIIVYVDDSSSWNTHPGSDPHIFDWWKTDWGDKMDLVWSQAIHGGEPRPGESVDDSLKDSRSLLLFKRRDQGNHGSEAK